MTSTKSRFLTLLILSSALTTATMSYAQTHVQAGHNIAVVQTQAGKVQGYIQNGVFTYKGVPYATAERFMPPQKLARWE